MLSKKVVLLVIVMIAGVLLVACQPETVEVVQEVDVTRVVTETVVEEGEQVEVTRVVTEVQEVMVTPEVEEVEEEVEPVTLYWNWTAEPPSLDPSLSTDNVSINAVGNTFMGLTRTDPDTGEVVPYLATDWEVSDDVLSTLSTCATTSPGSNTIQLQANGRRK